MEIYLHIAKVFIKFIKAYMIKKKNETYKSREPYENYERDN